MQQDVKWDIDIVVLHDWAEGAPARITYTNYVYDRSKEWSVACNLYAEVRRVLQHMKTKELGEEPDRLRPVGCEYGEHNS